MKKIWTIILAVFGAGGDAFADCYSEATNLTSEQMVTAVDYCLESEMERLREIQRQFHMVDYQSKLVLIKEARSMRSGWIYDDYIIQASVICTVCTEGEEREL